MLICETVLGLDRSASSPLASRHMSGSKLEILAYEPSPLGTLCLRRRELLSQPGTIVTEVTLNHEFLMSSLYTDSEQALARIAIEMHGGSELSILVGGLGLGYTAWEALKSDCAAQVEVVEFLPQVIDWLSQGLVPLAEQLLADSRFQVAGGDIYRRLAEPPGERFDVILIDVDHSPDERLGEESVAFYTAEGLQSARRHLAEDGILAVWSYDQSSPFADALHATFDEVRVEPVSYDNELIDEQQTDWLFFAR
jgi:spermidine synthase